MEASQRCRQRPAAPRRRACRPERTDLAPQQRSPSFRTGATSVAPSWRIDFAYRALLTEDRWRTVSGAFRDEYLRDRDERRQRERARGRSCYYVVRRHKLGGALLQLVRRTLMKALSRQRRPARSWGPSAQRGAAGRRGRRLVLYLLDANVLTPPTTTTTPSTGCRSSEWLLHRRSSGSACLEIFEEV